MSKDRSEDIEQFFAGESEMVKLIGSRDWTKTPLGDIKNWPQSLIFSVRICLNAKLPMAIWWGNDFIKIYNDSFCTLLGDKHPAALGAKGKDVWSEAWDFFSPALESIVHTGEAIWENKKLVLIRNGFPQECYFSFSHSPIYDDKGKIGGVLTIANETQVNEPTFRPEEGEEELKRREERYHKMIEEVQDYAIILLARDGTILNWNKGAEKIKGYHEEAIGQNFEIFYLESDRKNKLPQKLIHEALVNGRAMHEGWRKRKDNSKFWGSVVITALHDEKNNIIGFTKVTRDLTERKLAEDMLQQHANELEIKNRDLEQFAYIASHDLQEPLRKILTFSEVLEKKSDDKEIREKYLTKINSSVRRMVELIRSVLNYSRLSTMDDEFVKVDLNVILEDVKSDYELLIQEKQAVIKNDKLPVIKGIPLQLSQLFANLIGNALKFSEQNLTVTITSKVLSIDEVNQTPFLKGAQKYVELIFRDNGIGFEQDYAEKIFTIFQRLNSREKFAGTGIGLALCKKIVDNHHGYIMAKSELGKGSDFIIYLPYK